MSELARIGVQLFTFRAHANDLSGVLRRVAAMGYTGVETAGLVGRSPAAFRALLDEHGLEVIASHVALPTDDAFAADLDAHAELGARTVVTGILPEGFASADAVRASAEAFNRAAEEARRRGLRLAYHNHWWELEARVDDRVAFDVFVDLLDPDVVAEVDMYWVQTGGASPPDVVRALGRRARILHVKDGPCRVGEPMTAVGDGAVDVPATIAAGKALEWCVVELDAYDGDIFEAVERSYAYLTERGLVRAR